MVCGTDHYGFPQIAFTLRRLLCQYMTLEGVTTDKLPRRRGTKTLGGSPVRFKFRHLCLPSLCLASSCLPAFCLPAVSLVAVVGRSATAP